MKATARLSLLLVSLLLTTVLGAQSVAWTDIGTTSVWTNRNVGIGSSAINDRLTLQGGGVSINHPAFPYPYVGIDYDPTSDSLRFRGNVAQAVLTDTWLVIKRVDGKVGIGTTAPGDKLTVQGGALAFANPANSISYAGIDYDPSTDDLRVLTNYNGLGLNRTAISIDRPTHNVTIHENPSNSSGTRLTVQGNVSVTGSITGATVIGAVFQDIAEWVPAATDMPAGTVVRLNRNAPNVVEPSGAAYETTVAGVVSAQPGIILGVAATGKAQIATTGRVKVRATAAAAPIRIGDLLVSSEKPGVAMKSQPLSVGGAELHRPGTIIGKALEELPGGDGEILVLLSLQ